MKIGIMGAMEQETKLLTQSMTVYETKIIGMREYYIGQLFEKDVVVVFSKCGKVAAASTVTTLVEVFNVDLIIFTGVAGGADKSLNVGDIVIADKLVQHDMDASLLPGCTKFEIPLLGIGTFIPKENLVSQAVISAEHYTAENMINDVSREDLQEFNISVPNIMVGTVASGDQFIADRNKVELATGYIQYLH